MSEALTRRPTRYLEEVSPAAAEAFTALRDAVMAAGPLDRPTCELILIATLAVTGFEDAFKIHARRLLDMAVPVAAMKQAIMVTLAASTAIFQVARAMAWIEALERERASEVEDQPARPAA
jgi:alkylhydroperoxidase/carboxymuconolactone decarboxylase family protein YurZ